MCREKMMCSVLLLGSLMSCSVSEIFIKSGPWPVYQAEENHNVSLEWRFAAKTDESINKYQIYCEKSSDVWPPLVLFHLHEGLEVPQDLQFRGRVHCDRDVFREGRLRLHVSRLRIADSGVYVCQEILNRGVAFSELRLNVTAERPEPRGPNGVGAGMKVVYVALAVAAAALLAALLILLVRYVRRAPRVGGLYNTCDICHPEEGLCCSGCDGMNSAHSSLETIQVDDS